MSLEKITPDFEKFVIRFFTDVILIPKTIYKLFLDSEFAYTYASQELEKKEEEQFKDYVSPLKIALYCLILLLIFPNSNEHLKIDRITNTAKLNELEKCLYYFIATHFIPLLLTIIISYISRQPLTTSNYKKPFFTLVYTTAYVYLPITIMFSLAKFTSIFIDLDNITNSTSVNPYIQNSTIILLASLFIVLLIWSTLKFCISTYFSFDALLNENKWTLVLTIFMIGTTYYIFYNFLFNE